MRTLLYITISLLVCCIISCSKSENDMKDAHKLTDEIVLDSISIEDFKTLMDKAIGVNDTSDIQKLLGLAQNTYQKILVRNEAEAENFAQQVKAYILGEPYLDNLIANKENFFFKFNNDDYDEEEDKSKEDNDSIKESEKTLPDDGIVESETPDSQDNFTSTQPEQEKKNSEKKTTESKKVEDKKNSAGADVPPPPKDRVKNSFEKVPEKK